MGIHGTTTKYFRIPYLTKENYNKLIKDNQIAIHGYIDTIYPISHEGDILISITTINFSDFDKLEELVSATEIDCEVYIHAHQKLWTDYIPLHPTFSLATIMSLIDAGKLK